MQYILPTTDWDEPGEKVKSKNLHQFNLRLRPSPRQQVGQYRLYWRLSHLRKFGSLLGDVFGVKDGYTLHLGKLVLDNFQSLSVT